VVLIDMVFKDFLLLFIYKLLLEIMENTFLIVPTVLYLNYILLGRYNCIQKAWPTCQKV